MIFDKKRSVSVILSKLDKFGRNSEVEVAHEGGEHNEYSAFAEDIMSAVKSGSINNLAACLKSFHDMIRDADEEQDAGE